MTEVILFCQIVGKFHRRSFYLRMSGKCIRSGPTRVVALDISKAFDRVEHDGLLHKLESYVISGQVCALISSCLSNRRL